MTTGTRGEYSWIQADLRLHDFLALCPEVIADKYLAITAVDSGSFGLSESDRAKGWIERGGIAYSPRVPTPKALPSNCCCRGCYGFDEWYIFYSRPEPMGRICKTNVFATEIAPPNVFAFINFGGFSLSDPDMTEVTELFWQQMSSVLHDAYLGDGEDWLIFISRDSKLFAAAERALRLAE